MENTLSTTPGLVDVSSDLSDRRPLLAVTVDKRKAAALGFTQAEIGQVDRQHAERYEGGHRHPRG